MTVSVRIALIWYKHQRRPDGNDNLANYSDSTKLTTERTHPYIGLPDYQFWKKEKAIGHPELFDPITSVSFKIHKRDPIVTAGSCFAQHVARHLVNYGFNHLITERAHPGFPDELADQFNYGIYTARYGNIYTARQLKQLLQRAYLEFIPIESHWNNRNGRIIDPFRPYIQNNGFISVAELEYDRSIHFEAIREAIEELSVFVFTLGLTEAWIDRRDDAIYPVAPGVAGGLYDPNKYECKNFDVISVQEDIQWCINFIRNKNPDAKFILTISPVPLNATAINRHVYISTSYSKSVLRVAVEPICNDNNHCDYFPSFEIITSPYVRGQYYGEDCRLITEYGVNHVMKLFLKHYGDYDQQDVPQLKSQSDRLTAMAHIDSMQKIIDVICDEDSINNDK